MWGVLARLVKVREKRSVKGNRWISLKWILPNKPEQWEHIRLSLIYIMFRKMVTAIEILNEVLMETSDFIPFEAIESNIKNLFYCKIFADIYIYKQERCMNVKFALNKHENWNEHCIRQVHTCIRGKQQSKVKTKDFYRISKCGMQMAFDVSSYICKLNCMQCLAVFHCTGVAFWALSNVRLLPCFTLLRQQRDYRTRLVKQGGHASDGAGAWSKMSSDKVVWRVYKNKKYIFKSKLLSFPPAPYNVLYFLFFYCLFRGFDTNFCLYHNPSV